MPMRIAFVLALLLTACSGSEAEGRGGLSMAEADELNEAAALLDAQQGEADEAVER